MEKIVGTLPSQMGFRQPDGGEGVMDIPRGRIRCSHFSQRKGVLGCYFDCLVGTNPGFPNDSVAPNPLSCGESNNVMRAPESSGGSGFHAAYPPHPAGDFSHYIIGGSPPHTRALLN